jgi:hypothetical protein
MGCIKLPPGEKRSVAVYVLLRPREVAVLDALRAEQRRSRGGMLRDIFIARYKKTCPDLRERKVK